MSSRKALVFSGLGVLVLVHFVPFGQLLLYPFTLLATWVHEMGHGLTALMTGGRFVQLEIFSDASGLAQSLVTTHTAQGFTALGGLLAPPFVGAVILAVARGAKRARIVLFALAGALVISLAIWVRSPAGFISMPLVAALLGFVAWRGKPDHRLLLGQLVGLLLALDTVSRIDYVFMSSAKVGGVERPSDISMVAKMFGGPMFLWSWLVAALSLAACVVGLWAAWRKPRASGSETRGPKPEA